MFGCLFAYGWNRDYVFVLYLFLFQVKKKKRPKIPLSFNYVCIENLFYYLRVDMLNLLYILKCFIAQ